MQYDIHWTRNYEVFKLVQLNLKVEPIRLNLIGSEPVLETVDKDGTLLMFEFFQPDFLFAPASKNIINFPSCLWSASTVC